MKPEDVARLFHETYERLAPEHGYKTREASAVPWEDVPAANKGLMIAVAAEVGQTIERQVRERVAAETRSLARKWAANAQATTGITERERRFAVANALTEHAGKLARGES